MGFSTRSVLEFAELWNMAESIKQIAAGYHITHVSAVARARRIRDTGIPIKLLPDENKAYTYDHPPKPKVPKPPKPPKPPKAPKVKLPRAPKAKPAFSCHVQVMVTFETFSRLHAGVPVLSPDRMRQVISLGLDAEAAGWLPPPQVAAELPPLTTTPEAAIVEPEPAQEVKQAASALFDLFGPLRSDSDNSSNGVA